MLSNIHPYLTGDLLRHLDAMGHGDTVVLADAHFPGARLAPRLLDSPGVTTPDLVTAIRTVLPLDNPAVRLMTAPEGRLPVQDELVAAAGVSPQEVSELHRVAFYEAAAGAFLIVRTGEARPYGNIILSKGVVTTPHPEGH
ncbi:RbsD/FucU family protein [Streptomyces oceani]|uniref:Transport protein RbsD/FucU n=1 Tax=Streptomyces oceani TaxID=1075402 RepID=A0A1E7KJN7_9ACTN|nr:RbsD/FucU domain-containing protein [Streptomyces oceani]OEV04103.1 transport protein RbsD/FucU [Streptomyces oceani]